MKVRSLIGAIIQKHQDVRAFISPVSVQCELLPQRHFRKGVLCLKALDVKGSFANYLVEILNDVNGISCLSNLQIRSESESESECQLEEI